MPSGAGDLIAYSRPAGVRPASTTIGQRHSGFSELGADGSRAQAFGDVEDVVVVAGEVDAFGTQRNRGQRRAAGGLGQRLTVWRSVNFPR